MIPLQLCVFRPAAFTSFAHGLKLLEKHRSYEILAVDLLGFFVVIDWDLVLGWFWDFSLIFLFYRLDHVVTPLIYY